MPQLADACAAGDVAAVRRLLAVGNRSKNEKSSAGAPTTVLAAGGGHAEVVAVLVAGLAALVSDLDLSVAQKAAQFCDANDVPDVALLSKVAGVDDDFVRALGLKAGGVRERLVRQRLADLRR